MTSLKDWSGDSFLLNPEKIFSNRSKYSDMELLEYVALASFRSYAEYQATALTTLNVLGSTFPVESIAKHKLLTLVDGEIYFCWEEVTH